MAFSVRSDTLYIPALARLAVDERQDELHIFLRDGDGVIFQQSAEHHLRPVFVLPPLLGPEYFPSIGTTTCGERLTPQRP